MGDATGEYERVRLKYPRMPARDVAVYVAALVVLGVFSLFRDVSWFFVAGLASGVVAWEATKFRLRRNARRVGSSNQRG
jgi:hypothetical protein